MAIIKNNEMPLATIYYDGEAITNVVDSSTITLHCSGRMMKGNVTVELSDLVNNASSIEEVYEWPAGSDIDENVLYKRLQPVTMMGYFNGQPVRLSFKEFGEWIFPTTLYMFNKISTHYRKTYSELDSIPIDPEAFTLCYVEETAYSYVYIGGYWEQNWLEAFGMPISPPSIPVMSEEEAVDIGTDIFYTVLNYSYGKYENGQWQIVEPSAGTKILTQSDVNNVIDVREWSRLYSQAPHYYIASGVDYLPNDVNQGSIAIVLGGSV